MRSKSRRGNGSLYTPRWSGEEASMDDVRRTGFENMGFVIVDLENLTPV